MSHKPIKTALKDRCDEYSFRHEDSIIQGLMAYNWITGFEKRMNRKRWKRQTIYARGYAKFWMNDN